MKKLRVAAETNKRVIVNNLESGIGIPPFPHADVWCCRQGSVFEMTGGGGGGAQPY